MSIFGLQMTSFNAVRKGMKDCLITIIAMNLASFTKIILLNLFLLCYLF